ncbi:Mitochondrial distribution/morphology family 35/apoptosis [Phytophthora cactorum]|nr:Mitochondrial distribution/morphology family 35/apoptosis [Phytophthora cactorum]
MPRALSQGLIVSSRSLPIVRCTTHTEDERVPECEEQKERVKACYGDWFQKLWGGSWDRSDCEQETHDYRQCVQDGMKRRKEQGKRKIDRNVDNDWMDQAKDKSNEVANDAKSRKEDAKSKVKSKTSDVSSKVQEKADSWSDTIKGYAKKANDTVLGSDDDDD